MVDLRTASVKAAFIGGGGGDCIGGDADGRDAKKNLTGGRLRRAVRYAINGAPLRVIDRHCLNCHKGHFAGTDVKRIRNYHMVKFVIHRIVVMD